MSTRILPTASLVLSLLTVLPAAEPAAKRPITHEDLWLMKRVGRPYASPDGKRVVFSLTEPAYDSKDSISDLWLVPADGSAPARRITQTKGAETSVDWSPDGGKIAFASKREADEVSQIYVLNLAEGGEAERVTSLSTGARSPKWSPDGKQLLFVSEVYPGTRDDEANRKVAKERKARKWNARVYESFPVRYWDQWLESTQPHLFVQDARADAPVRDLLAGTQLVAKAGFAGRLSESGQDLPATWSPDGSGVVFVATRERNRSAYASVESALYLVPVAGGEPRALTTGPDGYGEPVFSPNGANLVVSLSVGGDNKIYHHERIAVFPWPLTSEKRVVVTSGLDLSVSGFVISRDSSRVHFLAEAGDQSKLYSVGLGGGTPAEIVLEGRGVLTGLSAGGDTVVALSESATQPGELVRLDLGKRVRAPLTAFNRDVLAKLDLNPVETFVFSSEKGRQIQSLLVKPAGFDASKKYPLFVVIHGGPAPQFKDAWSLRWNFQLLAAPGYVLLMTNYTGSRGYSEAFGQAIQGDPLKTPGDEINQAVDVALSRFSFIDGTKVVAGGASYGGHLANWLQATTTRYRALISHAGLVNLESQWATSDVIFHRELGNGGPIWEQGPIWREQNPVRLVKNHERKTGWITPMLLTVGEKDYRVPLNNTLENWSYHQRLQIPSKLIVFPEENHWILRGDNSRFWYGEVHEWIAKWTQ
ncbi:MAG: S9 family peptidase [Opitutaceae bacterium]|nr:S9 family peptidase [Opitutaceae bacterium]